MSLTPRQQRFVAEYLVDLNATQAAVRAGYSKRTAARIASETLKKPEVKAAVDAALSARLEKVEHTADDVIRELARMAFVDRGMKPPPRLEDLAAELRRDKLKALELLGKYHKLFTEKVEHSVTKSLEQILAEALK